MMSGRAFLAACLLAAAGCGAGSGLDVEVEAVPQAGVQPLAGGDPDYQAAGFAALESQAYWYSRYDLGALVMMSGNGAQFMPDMTMVQAMAAMVSDDPPITEGKSEAMPPMGVALLKRVFDENDPAFVPPPNPQGLEAFRWGPAPMTATTTLAAQGWTIIKMLEWAKQFHVDAHFGVPKSGDGIPGAMERFLGLVLFAEGLIQTIEVVSEETGNPAAFTAEDGGPYVMIEALSDMAILLDAAAVPHSKTNRYRAVAEMMAQNMTADEVAGAVRDLADARFMALPAPATIRERSLAIQALAWYQAASPDGAPAARVQLASIADRLLTDVPANAAERGDAIRGLIEAFRMTRVEGYRTAAAGHWKDLLAEYDAPHGVFRSQATYTASDLASILGALNALRLFGGADVEKPDVTAVAVNFFEAAVDRSGFQISSPPFSSIAAYETALQGDQPIFFRYPATPTPDAAGGPNGIAPVFAASTTFDPKTGRYTAEKTRYDTAGAMRLSNELMWHHHDEVEGFPPRIAPLAKGDPAFRDAGLSALMWEGYWYSRYDLGALVMMSGNGEAFMPPGPDANMNGMPDLVDTMIDMASDVYSKAMPPPGVALLKRVFDENDPAFVQLGQFPPGDLQNFRWGPAPMTATTSLETFGWTLVKMVEWAKQFHVDAHFGVPGANDGIPGAMQRFLGLVLFAEGLMQYLEQAGNPGAFTAPTIADEYVRLVAVSDLGALIAAPAVPHSKTNRYRAVAEMMSAGMPGMLPASADGIAAMILADADRLFARLPPPATIRERSLAAQALRWYAESSPTNREAARGRVVAAAAGLLDAIPATVADRGYAIRGLVEGFRASGDVRFLARAGALFQELVSDYDGTRGRFRSMDPVVTTEDVAAVIGALNALRLFGASVVDTGEVNAIALGFFEAVVNRGGMEISAPPFAEIAEYEREQLNSQEVLFRYPATPTPEAAGIAEVFASTVTFDPLTGTYTASLNPPVYDSAQAMHLSNELLWHHASEVNGFPGALVAPAGGGGATGGTGAPAPDAAVSFARDIQPIFEGNCSCHLAASAPQGLSLLRGVSYGKLLSVRSTEQPERFRVEPGVPAESYLLMKVTGDPRISGERMPRGRPPLAASEIDAIRRWIAEGAAEN